MKRRSRMWTVNKYTVIEARRAEFFILPDFGSTAHMTQGATLDAAFADLQDAGSKVSTTAQIAAYVCLSRIKQLRHIFVLQPCSPLLFSRGPPLGPDRLIRKLSGDITFDAARREWQADQVQEAVEEDENNPMTGTHLCTSCYLLGEENYMLPPNQFGVKKASDFF